MARRTHDPDTPRELPWTGFFVWVAMIPVFIGSWADHGGAFFWPIFPIGGWGIALYTKYAEIKRHNDQIVFRQRRAAALGAPPVAALPTPASTPTAAPAATPNRVGGGSAETAAAPLVPQSLRAVSDEVERLCRDLIASDRGQVAEGVEMGLREAIRLTHLRHQIGDIDTVLAEARAEVAHLTAQAEKATDPAAAGTWRQSADAAARRVEKVEALRATDERAEARIASFVQLVKSLSVDVAREDLTSLDETLTLADLADQAHRVDREVEALHRTNDELRTLSSTRRAQGA